MERLATTLKHAEEVESFRRFESSARWPRVLLVGAVAALLVLFLLVPADIPDVVGVLLVLFVLVPSVLIIPTSLVWELASYRRRRRQRRRWENDGAQPIAVLRRGLPVSALAVGFGFAVCGLLFPLLLLGFPLVVMFIATMSGRMVEVEPAGVRITDGSMVTEIAASKVARILHVRNSALDRALDPERFPNKFVVVLRSGGEVDLADYVPNERAARAFADRANVILGTTGLQDAPPPERPQDRRLDLEQAKQR